MKLMLRGVTEIIRGDDGEENITYNDVKEYSENFLIGNTITKKIKDEKCLNEKDSERIKVHKFDIIFPIKRQDHVPKFINWEEDYIISNYRYAPDILCVRTINSSVNPKFLFYILNTRNIRNYINGEASKFKPNRISSDMIRKFRNRDS